MAADTYEITEGFDEPLFSGSPLTVEPDRTGYPVSLDGRGFLVDWRSQIPYTRQGVQLLNTQQAQSGGDQAQVPPEIWRRTAESWHFGEGQAHLDRDESLPYRYSASSGVDPWTPWTLSLLHDTTLTRSLTGGRTVTITVAGYVLVALGSTGWWLDTTTLAWTSADFGQTVVDLTSDGTSAYALLADGTVDAWTDPTTSTALVTAAVTNWDSTRARLNVVKGFLLLSNQNVLYDATSGTPAAIFTHPNANWTWGAACDGASAGFLIGGTGDRWHVHALPLKDDATTLNPPLIAATLPDGEVPTALAEYLGFLLIGSQRGFRLADASAGQVTYGRLVVTDHPVECFEGQDRFVWFGRSTTTGDAGLGRADLSTFVGPLTPAVATDLTGTGAGRVGGVVTVGEKRLFVVDGVGAFLEADTLVEDGWVESGAMTFGSNDRKQGVYVQVFYDAPSGGTLLLDYRVDGGAWVNISSAVSGSTIGNVPLEVDFTTIETRLRFTSDTATYLHAPVITRIEVRALVVPGRASEWTLPLVIADSLEYQGAVESRDVIGDIDHLLSLVRTRRPFLFREGERTWGVYATDFRWMPNRESQHSRSHQGTFVLNLKEIA